jgi:Rieske Fe-S protein
MERSEFISKGLGCIGAFACGVLFSGCTISKTLSVVAMDGQLRLNESDFRHERNPDKWLAYVIVESKSLDDPLVVYRYSLSEYRAFLLKCTHQGTRLDVHGDLISCPAHGSEFDKTGVVINGPAAIPLKEFPVELRGNQITIRLS